MGYHALILAGLFEQAGLAMIIGAYIMGLSLSKTDVSHVVRENLEPIFHLLVKLFENPASGLRRQVEGHKDAELSFTFPSARTAELIVGNLLKVFESEGFFVHVLNHREHIYHIRKDDIVIGFQRMLAAESNEALWRIFADKD